MIAELPLFLFSTLSGMAAGTYAAGAFVPAVRGTARKRWAFPLACLVLLGCGLAFTLAHLGHPERFMNALANPTAMIAQEAYWAMALGVVVLADVVIAKVKGSTPVLLTWVGALLAVGLAVVTGLAYFVCYGVFAWSQPSTIALFVVGDVAMGLAIALAFAAGEADRAGVKTALVAVEAVLGIVLALEGLVFSQAGANAGLAIAGVIVGPAASIALALAGSKVPPAVRDVLTAALTVVGVAIVRYGFYGCA